MRIRYRIKVRFFLTLGVILIFLGLWIYTVLQHKEPVCMGVNISSNWDWYIYSKEELLRELEQFRGTKMGNEKLKDIDLLAIQAKLEQKPWIRRAKIFFNPRHILELKIEYRVPVAKIYFTARGIYKYFDAEGVLLPSINGSFAKLPLFVSHLPETASIFHEQTHSMVELLYLCEKDSVWASLFDFIDIQDANHIIVRLKHLNTIVLLGGLDNLRDKISRFATFYSYFWAKKGKSGRVIDLRFKRQVLTR